MCWSSLTVCGLSASEPQRVVLFNGTNKDDLSDPTRVGLIAAKDFHVYRYRRIEAVVE